MARSTNRSQGTQRSATAVTPAEHDPLWYKNAVIYQLHVRSFHDSDGNGIGDFAGLTEKLPYLQDLGVTAIWILPFYPSPLKDDGYDIADYTGVNPSYGNIADVKRFVNEAHERGMRVITELVINHTSDQHPWFQRARRSPPGSKHRDFYVWSDDPTKYAGTRIIFKDFETSNWAWDPVAKAYYWHRFYSHQPDLNFDNPAVMEAVLRVLDQWMEIGIDGLRLDAIPYLFEREGTSCENLPETHAALKEIRAHVQKKWPGRMLLAEANQWPEDAIAYFGDGDECHMAFHFPLMPRLFMSIRMEDRLPIIDILEQTPAIPETCQWAIFLRNHDELTLEMVTDEERDYMYRVYASDREARINLGIRRRLAPLLSNNRRKIELMNALLFSMPGTPVIYYGDEIGMGDNIFLGDRNGVRTPMQWNGDRNAGFSRASPQRLFLPVIIEPEYHYETVNVESQQANPSSLLWWMKRLIALRKHHRVFGEGSISFLHASNPKVLAFTRELGDETVLVVVNLSRFSQPADIDLSRFRGYEPVEMFGRTKFPAVGDRPYFLTLGPHSFYWFLLQPTPAATASQNGVAPALATGRGTAPSVALSGAPADWFRDVRSLAPLEAVLASDIQRRRWFGSKAKAFRAVRILDAVPLKTAAPVKELAAGIVIAQVDFADAEPETYAIPLAVVSPVDAAHLLDEGSAAVIAEVRGQHGPAEWVVFDGMAHPAVAEALMDTVARRKRHKGAIGELAGTSTQHLGRIKDDTDLAPRLGKAEQSNSSIAFGDRFILKLFRRLEEGQNPDLELSRHLTEQAGFEHTAPLAGAIEYHRPRAAEPQTLAMLQVFVPNQGDAWAYTLDEVGRYYERVQTLSDDDRARFLEGDLGSLLDLSQQDPPPIVGDVLGDFLTSAALLGERTGQMHLALASAEGNPAVDPEPFTPFYQRSLYQSMRGSAQKTFGTLRKALEHLAGDCVADGQWVLDHEREILERFRSLTGKLLSGMRIRVHGDYHLGQVLWTGRDFVIIDFEGEPSRSIGERRLKRSALRDVAGMIRSLDYAAHAALLRHPELSGGDPAGAEQARGLELARRWRTWAGAAFLRTYLQTVRATRPELIPQTRDETELLMGTWLLEKALYEVLYELNSRPAWAGIPLRAVRQIMGGGVGAGAMTCERRD